jgi:hypothetical protein
VIHPRSALLLRTFVGEAVDPNTGKEYELSLVNGYMPCVKSLASGRSFVLGFDDILKQAIEAGVDNEEEA